MLTKVNGFAFRPKIYYLCSTEVEIPRSIGASPLFFAIFRQKIGKITRRIRKITRRIRKIIRRIRKIISILVARKPIIISKMSIMNVNVC